MRTPSHPLHSSRPLARVAALVALIALAGCAGPATTPDRSGNGGGPAAAPASQGAPADAKAAPESGGGDPQALASDRQIVRSAALGITVTDPGAAAKNVEVAVKGLGGMVTNSNVVTAQTDGRYMGTSTVTVGVPGDKLDQALDAISAVGTVTLRSVQATDVTDQLVDLEARIKVQRESVDRMSVLLAKAGSVSDIASVEREVTSRQAELERMLAQQKNLQGHVAMSSIVVTLTPLQVTHEANPFLQGMSAGWDALLASLKVILTIVGGLLPFAVIAVALWLPYWFWRKKHPRTPSARGTLQTLFGPPVAATPFPISGPMPVQPGQRPGGDVGDAHLVEPGASGVAPGGSEGEGAGASKN